MTLLSGRDIRCDGSIPNQITQAAELVEEWVPTTQRLGKSGRFEPHPIIPRVCGWKAWSTRSYTGPTR